MFQLHNSFVLEIQGPEIKSAEVAKIGKENNMKNRREQKDQQEQQLKKLTFSLQIQFFCKNPSVRLEINFKHLAKNQLFQQLKKLIILQSPNLIFCKNANACLKDYFKVTTLHNDEKANQSNNSIGNVARSVVAEI